MHVVHTGPLEIQQGRFGVSNQVYHHLVDYAAEEAADPTGGLPPSHGENSDTHCIAPAKSFFLPNAFFSAFCYFSSLLFCYRALSVCALQSSIIIIYYTFSDTVDTNIHGTQVGVKAKLILIGGAMSGVVIMVENTCWYTYNT